MDSDDFVMVWIVVALEDAAEQPGTVVLYMRNADGSFEPMSDGGATLNYEGDETDSWDPSDDDSCLTGYIPLGSDKIGAIEWVRASFNYEFPDGTKGTITSEQMPAWVGTYIHSPTSTSGATGATLSYPIEQTLVTDMDKLTPMYAYIEVSGESYSIPTSCLSIQKDTGSAVLDVSYSELESLLPTGTTLTPGTAYPVSIELYYENDGIKWYAEENTGTLTVSSSTATPPEISYGHLWYWGGINGGFNADPSDPGFRLIELQCDITPNDATNITFDATVSSEMHTESYSWTGEPWTGGSAAGPMTLYEHAVEEPAFVHSLTDPTDPDELDKYWAVSVVMHYTLDGETGTRTLTVPGSEVDLRAFGPEVTISHSDGVTDISFGADADDPFAYDISGIERIGVEWYRYYGGSDYYESLGTEQQIYPGGTLTAVTAGSAYRHTVASPLTPPSGATHMVIHAITTSPFTGENTDGRHEDSNGPLDVYSDYFPVSSGPSLGNYVQGGYSSSLPESTRSNPTPAGFRTTVYLDEEIVGQPDTTQPYGDGQTLELTSVKLTKNGGDAETVLVDNVIFHPVESPYLTFEYHAPSDQPLEIDDYELEVELNYNAPNEDPPVADLVDSDSHTFSVVPETLFGDGEFTYSPSSYLGGSIPLLGGINSDQLTEIEFTIYQGWSDITSQVAPNSHQIPAAGSAENWIGFELKASDGDTIPTFNASAEYYVMVSAKYKGEAYFSPRIRIMMPSGPTGSYLGPGTVSMIEISLSEGFTAKFPLDLSIVPDASDDTISAVSVTLTRPDGATQDLLGDPDSEYYVYSEGANTLFEFRYECPADPLPTGNYTLNVTLTYTSGTVTNLQSSNSASFTVVESPPDYDYWVIDPETWCDPPATGATTVVAKTELIVEYDPEYSYSATVTGGRIIWTVDGTQQSSVAISPLPAMTDNPDQERLESGLVGFTVALPTTGTDWSYKLEFDLDVAASDGSDTTHFSVTVSSSEFSVPLPPQHNFSPSVSVNSADAGTTLELTANGRVVIAYNTETGFTYSAELTALEISLDDGATFQTVDGTYWGYSAASGDVGTLSYDFWIGSGYTLPVEASSARLRFTAHITGEHGSDSYDTTVYPAGTTSITINP